MPISPKACRAGLELDTIAISLCLSRPGARSVIFWTALRRQLVRTAMRRQRLSVVRFFETGSGSKKGRLWLVWLMTLRGFALVLQAALGDGLSFDPFSLQQDCLAASEVDVGRG